MPESYSNGYRLKKLYSTVHSSWKTRKFVQKSKVYSNFVMFIEGLVLGKFQEIKRNQFLSTNIKGEGLT